MAVCSGTKVPGRPRKFLHGVVDKLRLGVERQIELSTVIDAKGTTLYEQLTHIKDTYGEVDPLLEPVGLPTSAKWIFDVFWRLNKKRDSDGMSGAPKVIPFTEIEAFSRLEGIRFSQFDLEALQAMEDAYFEALNNQNQRKEST